MLAPWKSLHFFILDAADHSPGVFWNVQIGIVMLAAGLAIMWLSFANVSANISAS